jgi:hypothetical protein
VCAVETHTRQESKCSRADEERDKEEAAGTTHVCVIRYDTIRYRTCEVSFLSCLTLTFSKYIYGEEKKKGRYDVRITYKRSNGRKMKKTISLIQDMSTFKSTINI